MANNQKKLKAFVRYDGSGRVVASSLILRKNKPRVGRWFEIPTFECCNGSGTTTTTTTNGGGGGTVTAFIKDYWSTPLFACNGTTEGTLLFYSSSPVLEAGIEIFYDAALTTRIPYGYVINTGAMTPKLQVSSINGLLTDLVCSNPLFLLGISYVSSSQACQQIETYNFYTNGATPGNSVVLYYDQALTIPANNIPYLTYNNSLYHTDQNGVMIYDGAC